MNTKCKVLVMLFLFTMERKYGLLKTLILILVFLSSISTVGFSQEQDIVAVVIRINGTLEFRKTSSDDWASAKVEDTLSNGYQLRTQTGDKAIVRYASGTRVLINENTHIEIQADISRPGEKPSMERTKIMDGEIINRVKGNYEVETPSSVASVRETEFNFSSKNWKMFENDGTILVKVQSKMESIQVNSSTFSSEIENLSVNPK